MPTIAQKQSKQVHRWDYDKDSDTVSIHPALLNRVNKLISRMNAHGYVLLVTDGYRTPAQQAALYAIGRTLPGRKVTNLRLGTHCTGLAADIAFVQNGKITWSPFKVDTTKYKTPYALLGAEARNLGLVWGGDWKFVDMPHVQLCSVSSQGVALHYLGEGMTLPGIWTRLQREGRIPTV